MLSWDLYRLNLRNACTISLACACCKSCLFFRPAVDRPAFAVPQEIVGDPWLLTRKARITYASVR